MTKDHVPLVPGDWPLIELGYGLVEVAEGHHDESFALIFGRNGSGKVGEPTQPDRVHLPGETLAVVTFANVESLDVVARKLATIRERMTAVRRVCPACNGNDRNEPCAYPSENKPGCLRDRRLAGFPLEQTATGRCDRCGHELKIKVSSTAVPTRDPRLCEHGEWRAECLTCLEGPWPSAPTVATSLIARLRDWLPPSMYDELVAALAAMEKDSKNAEDRR